MAAVSHIMRPSERQWSSPKQLSTSMKIMSAIQQAHVTCPRSKVHFCSKTHDLPLIIFNSPLQKLQPVVPTAVVMVVEPGAVRMLVPSVQKFRPLHTKKCVVFRPRSPLKLRRHRPKTLTSRITVTA